MIRLFLLFFALNTLLPPVGAAMMSVSATHIMSQTGEHSISVSNIGREDVANSHCLHMSSHDICSMDGSSSDLCKAKCAVSCAVSAIHIANFSFSIPFIIADSHPENSFLHFYSRSISPELRPPLV